MPKLIEFTTTAIIIVSLVVILAGCSGNHFANKKAPGQVNDRGQV
jgi:hypothetical protein